MPASFIEGFVQGSNIVRQKRFDKARIALAQRRDTRAQSLFEANMELIEEAKVKRVQDKRFAEFEAGMADAAQANPDGTLEDHFNTASTMFSKELKEFMREKGGFDDPSNSRFVDQNDPISSFRMVNGQMTVSLNMKVGRTQPQTINRSDDPNDLVESKRVTRSAITNMFGARPDSEIIGVMNSWAALGELVDEGGRREIKDAEDQRTTPKQEAPQQIPDPETEEQVAAGDITDEQPPPVEGEVVADQELGDTSRSGKIDRSGKTDIAAERAEVKRIIEANVAPENRDNARFNVNALDSLVESFTQGSVLGPEDPTRGKARRFAVTTAKAGIRDIGAVLTFGGQGFKAIGGGVLNFAGEVIRDVKEVFGAKDGAVDAPDKVADFPNSQTAAVTAKAGRDALNGETEGIESALNKAPAFITSDAERKSAVAATKKRKGTPNLGTIWAVNALIRSGYVTPEAGFTRLRTGEWDPAVWAVMNVGNGWVARYNTQNADDFQFIRVPTVAGPQTPKQQAALMDLQTKTLKQRQAVIEASGLWRQFVDQTSSSGFLGFFTNILPGQKTLSEEKAKELALLEITSANNLLGGRLAVDDIATAPAIAGYMQAANDYIKSPGNQFFNRTNLWGLWGHNKQFPGIAAGLFSKAFKMSVPTLVDDYLAPLNSEYKGAITEQQQYAAALVAIDVVGSNAGVKAKRATEELGRMLNDPELRDAMLSTFGLDLSTATQEQLDGYVIRSIKIRDLLRERLGQ